MVNNYSKVTILAEKAHLLAVKLAVIKVCQQKNPKNLS